MATTTPAVPAPVDPKSKQAGAFGGGLVGGLAGAGLGAAGGYLSADPNDPDPENQKRRAMLGSLIGAGAGGLAGTTLGALGEANEANNQAALQKVEAANALTEQKNALNAEHAKALGETQKQLEAAKAEGNARVDSTKTSYGTALKAVQEQLAAAQSAQPALAKVPVASPLASAVKSNSARDEIRQILKSAASCCPKCKKPKCCCKKAADMTDPAQRKKVPSSEFAMPKSTPKGETHEEAKGKYPMPDASHARAALGFAAMHHGKDSAEYKAVERKAHSLGYGKDKD